MPRYWCAVSRSTTRLSSGTNIIFFNSFQATLDEPKRTNCANWSTSRNSPHQPPKTETFMQNHSNISDNVTFMQWQSTVLENVTLRFQLSNSLFNFGKWESSVFQFWIYIPTTCIFHQLEGPSSISTSLHFRILLNSCCIHCDRSSADPKSQVVLVESGLDLCTASSAWSSFLPGTAPLGHFFKLNHQWVYLLYHR